FMFIDRGRVVLECTMEEFESRYAEVTVNPDQLEAARAFKPINERQLLARRVLLFDRADRQQLTQFGEVRTPGIADVFVAVVGEGAGQ
ncbi:MAG TPA: ABC transporter ATP-binding protein, partial [Thermoanaerobaculia bacterium]|nr:ABC transporter ATP-binding protein [Thermoanaerobaculia bacterium]